MAEREQARTLRAIEFLDRAAGKRWFWPTVGLFPVFDYVLPVLPNQLLMIALSALNPRKWWLVALVFVAASALGAFGTAWLIQLLGDAWAELMPFAPSDSDSWQWTLEQVRRWGLPAVAVLALLPVPPRLAVIACAVAGLPPEGIAASVAAGRSVPAIAIAFLSARAPAMLAGLPFVGRAASVFLDRRQG